MDLVLREGTRLMRILLIRHGDPDYENDSLTEKGRREAHMLASRLINERIDYIYTSTMGRAMETAKPTLEAKGMKAEPLDWLREFSAKRIRRPDYNGELAPVCWDWLPEDWTVRPVLYDKDNWFKDDIMAEPDMESYEKMVHEGLDELLAKHGYEREGLYYRAVKANDDTIALFCHFGLGCVILSHLLGIAPLPLMQGFAAAPTSVTTIYTEERREGIASFRVACYGDTTHLYVNNEKPSFSARFCEMYSNTEERHD